MLCDSGKNPRSRRSINMFFFSSRRRQTRFDCDWSSDVCSSDLKKVYEAVKIEKKWQKIWEEKQPFRIDNSPKKKYYVLEMFPYPSGKLHMGHLRNYSIGDVIARFKRMNGFDVLYPMGYDAFGLPAENAAIKNKTHPAKWTFDAIESIKKQQKLLGLSYDWKREIATCKEGYYKWNQIGRASCRERV